MTPRTVKANGRAGESAIDLLTRLLAQAREGEILWSAAVNRNGRNRRYSARIVLVTQEWISERRSNRERIKQARGKPLHGPVWDAGL